MAKKKVEYINVDKTDDGGMILRWTEINPSSRQPDYEDHQLAYTKDKFEEGMGKLAELYREKLS